MIACPNKSSKEWKDLLAKHNGDEDLAASEWSQTYGQEEEIKEPKQLDKIEQFFHRRISRLTKEISQASGVHLINLQKEIDYTKQKLADSKKATSEKEKKDVYVQFGKHALDLINLRLKAIEEGKIQPSSEDMDYIQNVVDTWKSIKEVAYEALDIEERLNAQMSKFIETTVSENYPGDTNISMGEIKSQNQDISTRKYWTGSLIDLPNYLAHAIGSIVRAAQTKIERNNNKLFREINEKVAELEDKSGKRIQEIFDELIEVEVITSPNGHVFTKKQLVDSEEVKTKSPEAQEFYKFYKKKMDVLKGMTPTLTRRNENGDLELFALPENFIPNLPRDKSLKEKAKKAKSSLLGLVGERILGDTTKNEEQKADAIHLDFVQNIPADKKSDDLAGSLFEFARSVHNYDEMSQTLPKVRLLQKQIENTEYVQGSNPNFTKSGVDSNIYKAVEAFIRAQVKGEYKLEQGRPGIGKSVNEEGKETERYIDITGTIDNLLSWNSLNKIGLAPIGALANASFGKLSNFIEAFGGRFVTRKDLRVAEKIFWKQTLNPDSVLNKELLEKYNVLQELTDYELEQKIKTGAKKYLTGDKLKEILYTPQKYGEKWIQASMMLGVMHHEGYINEEGELTDKFKELPEAKREQLFNRITGINNKLHGRYSPKESAAMQQHVLYRVASQFKKWIPAAIEARLDEKHFDPRLGVEVEGRYRTFARVFLKELIAKDPSNAFFNLLMPVLNAKKALESGKLTESEVYNMRKMFIETILVLGTWLSVMAFKGGDDDDKKKAWYKSSMKLLDRVHGDVTFFFSPQQLNNTLKNPAPVLGLTQQLIGLATGLPKALSDEKLRSNEKTYTEKLGRLLPAKSAIFDLYDTFNDKVLPEH